MKSKEEIDELYHKCWDDFSNKYDDNLHYYSFVEGYTQSQEDMAKELEELREAIRKNTWYDEDGWAQVNLYGIDNNLLNKQD